jgi:hypothetical protein
VTFQPNLEFNAILYEMLSLDDLFPQVLLKKLLEIAKISPIDILGRSSSFHIRVTPEDTMYAISINIWI